MLSPDFKDCVLGWKKSDCVNKDLFKKEIRNLPDSFEELEAWSTSYYDHVLEEMRASIQKELESENFAKTAFTTLPGNVIYISEKNLKLPWSCLVLLVFNSGASNSLAEMEHHGYEDDPHIFVLKDRKIAEKFFKNEAKGWDLFILPTTIPCERIWNALRAATKLPKSRLLDEMLSCKVSYDVVPSDLLDSLIFNTLTQHLNESQKCAIRSVITSIKSYSSNGSHINVIRGPPGTGKTNTIASLITTVLQENLGRLHVAAPTNYAIVELCSRTIRTIKEGRGNGIEHLWKLRHFVLVGNDERMKPPPILQEIYINARVKRLENELLNWSAAATDFRVIHRSEPENNIIILHGDKEDDSENISLASEEIPDLRETLSRCINIGAVIRDDVPDFFIDEEQRGLFGDIVIQATAYLAAAESSKHIPFELFKQQGLETKLMELIDRKMCSQTASRASTFLTLNFADRRRRIMDEARVVFSTVSGGGAGIFSGQLFDVVIIDEATQLVEAATSIMILNPNLKCLVLAGDNMQLPSTVQSDLNERHGYGRSLFDRLLHHNFPSNLLNTQYRMHPEISVWPNAEFYKNSIIDGENVLSDSYNKHWHESFPPFSIYDLRGEEELYLQSRLNRSEINATASIVRAIYKIILNAPEYDSSKVKVGILSPYSAQVQFLNERMKTMDENFQKDKIEIICRTIDGFQGQECDIIILSTVRSNSHGALGFVSDYRRLNVAITRSRFSLIIVGNCDTLSFNDTWHRLINSTANMETEVSSSILKKVCADARKEMKDLKELNDVNGCVFENSAWSKKIIIKDTFRKSFPSITDKNKRGRIFNLLLRLANGDWSRREQEILGIDSPIDYKNIINATILDGQHLVWSIDLEKRIHSNKNPDFYQRIIIWDFVSAHSLEKLANRIAKSMTPYSAQYLSRCRQRGNLPYISQEWKSDINFDIYSTEKHLVENTEVEISLSLMKSFSLNSKIARSLFLSNEFSNLEFAHDVSAEEKNLIENDELSQIVCGRSGTGKTTVMIHRMYRLDLASRKVEDDTPLHQMMVTASPVLAAAIKKNYENMLLSNKVIDMNNEISNENNNGSDNDDSGDKRNDYTLENTNLSKRYSVKHYCASSNNLGAAAVNDEEDVPSYPLILTYNEFLRMVDKTLVVPFFGNEKMKEVDLHRFESVYYPQLGSVIGENRKKIDSAGLFTEIMSCIKGSLASLKMSETDQMKRDSDLNRTDGCLNNSQKNRELNARSVLDRSAYVALSYSRRGSGLSSNQREIYYNLYEKYQELKSFENNDYDIADCVSHIYRSLVRDGYHGSYLEHIYVDEVQDLTESQICLFKFVCNNPHGYFFAGDTAQTIANGVGFQFNSLKDLFHSEFLTDDDDKSELTPNVQQLKQNFRTHNGVLTLANTVIKLISFFFPLTIDKLADETSLVLGPKPIFLKDEIDVISALFSDSTKCEFGSEQVILTRDVATKEKLRSICKDSALVLTVLEAKGMEFQDCLIYNFFSSGDLGSKWRILGGAYEFLGAPGEDGKPWTEFDSSVHSVLNLELKYLYVLLTRAKKNLVIFEENVQVRGPILKLWTHNDINAVDYKLFDDDMRDIFSEKSDPDVWVKKGIEFFDRKNYESAKTCFFRGGDKKGEGRSNAHLLDSQAAVKENLSKLKSLDEKRRNILLKESEDLYVRSAEEFDIIGDHEMAGHQYEMGKNHTKAADIYVKLKLYSKAGDCYKILKKWQNAANNYVKCNMIENAIDCCLQGDLYHRALDIFDNGESSTYVSNDKAESNIQDTNNSDIFDIPKVKERNIETITTVDSTIFDANRDGRITNTNSDDSDDDDCGSHDWENTWNDVDVVPVDQSHGQNGFENENQSKLNIASSTCISSAQLISQPSRVFASFPPSFLASTSSIPKVLSIDWGNSLEMKALREKILHKAGEHYSKSDNIPIMMFFIEKMNSKQMKKDFLSLHDHLDLLINIELQDNNFHEASMMMEASGDYDNARTFYLKSQNHQKVSELGLKLARMKILNDEFLPTLSMDEITSKMVKESVDFANSSPILSILVKEKINFEFYLLQNHLTLKLNDIYLLKLNASKSAQPHRLMLIATRCIFRNLTKRNETTKKNEITGKEKTLIDGDEIFKLDSTIYSCFQSYKALCATAFELFSSLDIIISHLQQLNRTNNTAVRTTENESLTSQCEELFEFKRSMNNPFGGCSLIVEDLPAATKIWSTEKKPITINNLNIANKTKTKIEVKSDAGGIMNLYQELSSTKKSSLASGDIINVQKKIRKEINMKIFTEKAENFLVQKIYYSGFDYFNKIFLSLLRQTNLENEKNSEKLNIYGDVYNGKGIQTEGMLGSTTSMRLQFLEESCKIGFIIEDKNPELLKIASAYFIMELRPLLPSREDMQEIVKLRKNEMLQRCLAKGFPTEIITISYSFEAVATRLLTATSIITLDKYQYYVKLIKALESWREGENNATLLCRAFQYEESSVAQKTESSNMISNLTWRQNAEKADYFLVAISQGAHFLSLNWSAGNPLCVNSACLSPGTYIMILEKYVVMLLLYSRQCENVLIPTSLLLDVFCCQNSAYGSMIRCCLMGNIFSDEKRREMSAEMGKLIGPLILLFSDGYASMETWVKQSIMNKSSGAVTEKEIEKVISYLMIRSYSLLLTLILNENNEKRRIDNIVKLTKSFGNGTKKLLTTVSNKMNNFLTNLKAKTTPQEFIDFFKLIEDPMVFTTIQEESRSNQKLKLQQAFLYVETIEGKDFINATIRPYVPKPDIDYNTIGQGIKILKRPEKKDETKKNQPENENKNENVGKASTFEFSASADDSLNSAPPPPPPPSSSKIQDPFSAINCYKIFQILLQEARNRINKFTNKEIYLRELESQFRQISAKFQRNHDFVQLYIKQIMPLLEDVKYYSNVIEFLGQSDIEIRGTLSLNDLKENRIKLQSFLSKVIPSGLQNVVEFALNSNNKDDMSIYIYKINDDIVRFLNEIKESKPWQNYILIYKDNHPDDDALKVADTNNDKKEVENGNGVGQNRNKGDKKTNEKKKSTKKNKK